MATTFAIFCPVWQQRFRMKAQPLQQRPRARFYSSSKRANAQSGKGLKRLFPQPASVPGYAAIEDIIAASHRSTSLPDTHLSLRFSLASFLEMTRVFHCSSRRSNDLGHIIAINTEYWDPTLVFPQPARVRPRRWFAITWKPSNPLDR